MPRMSKSKNWNGRSSRMTGDARRTTRSAVAASTIASRVSGLLPLLVRIISQRGQKRVAQLRTLLADLTENRHSSRITPDQRGCDEKSISN